MMRLSNLSISEMQVLESCPECGHGTVGKVTINGVERTLYLTCECEEPKEKPKESYSMIRAFGKRVPRGSFEDDDYRNKAVSKACSDYASYFGTYRQGKVNGLMLFGSARQGKTFMAEAVASVVIRDGFTVLFRTAAEIVQAYQYNDKSEIKRLRDSIDSVDLLVIDDLGAQRSTAFADEIIFTIIDSRYSVRKPMLITTNATAEEMAGAEDITLQRCYGRLIERCKLVEIETGRTCVG